MGNSEQPARVRVLVTNDDGAWTAQCLEYDIGTQAPDLKLLVERFRAVFEAERLLSLEKTGREFGGIPPAPEFIQMRWDDGAPTLNLSDDGDAPYTVALAA